MPPQKKRVGNKVHLVQKKQGATRNHTNPQVHGENIILERLLKGYLKLHPEIKEQIQILQVGVHHTTNSANLFLSLSPKTNVVALGQQKPQPLVENLQRKWGNSRFEYKMIQHVECRTIDETFRAFNDPRLFHIILIHVEKDENGSLIPHDIMYELLQQARHHATEKTRIIFYVGKNNTVDEQTPALEAWNDCVNASNRIIVEENNPNKPLEGYVWGRFLFY
jgi:hypothetical protein